MSAVLLQTHSLSIGYSAKNLQLFENLDLQLKAGELVCFMGPNGIGKSTLIRTLAGLQKPLKGNVKVPLAKGEVAPESIAVVLTEKVNALNLSVKEVVAYGRYPYLNWNVQLNESDQEMIAKALRQVNIQHLSDRSLFELSDGQLQMAMIARALAQDTPIILLDEPTAHLDLNNRVEIMKTLKKLSHELNKAILISTHELDLALQMADLVWLTGNEKSIITGIPEDLVLNGSFDEVFQFKGFDLKSGKIDHPVLQRKKIKLTGSGAEFLWSRNALQRNGFEIVDHEPDCIVTVVSSREWKITAQGDSQTLNTLHDVLQFLK